MSAFWDRVKHHFYRDNPGFRGMFGMTSPEEEYAQLRAEAGPLLDGPVQTIEQVEQVRDILTRLARLHQKFGDTAGLLEVNNLLMDLDKSAQQIQKVSDLQTIPQGRLVFENFHDDDMLRELLFNPTRPYVFASLVGNDEAKEVVAWSLFEALGLEDHVLRENFLFTGPASSGKTMFARVVADILGIPFLEIAAPTLAKQRQPLEYLLDKIIETCEAFEPPRFNLCGKGKIVGAKDLTLRPRLKPGATPFKKGDKLVFNLNQYTLPPMVVFIDEAHALPSAVEQALLKVTERSDAFMTTETDSTADCSKVCWILATTERGKLFKPFDTRFEKINLRLYTKEEIAEIIHGIEAFEDWDMDACRLVAHYCNRIPREAISFAKKVKQALRATPGDFEDIAAKVAERKGIDPHGMTYQRLNILKMLGQRPASMNALCASLGCEEEEIRKFILPWLLATTPDQEPYVVVTNRHYITQAGLDELDKRGISHKPASEVLSNLDYSDSQTQETQEKASQG